MEIEPGIEAGTTRSAGRRLRIMLGEQHAVPGQTIQVRRLEAGMAEGRQAIATPLVRVMKRTLSVMGGSGRAVS